jgi:hypothetical protein
MSPCVVIDANRIFSELIAANHQLAALDDIWRNLEAW